ncbi:MAK10-like protein [Tanacetum coccineum]|uniref:MAK10-like protein n=1 Tax=Tanacetum coccineum TaxID=301880 RepID=A0ABQ5FQX0_9ASTR
MEKSLELYFLRLDIRELYHISLRLLGRICLLKICQSRKITKFPAFTVPHCRSSLQMQEATPPAVIGSLLRPFGVQHGNMAAGPRASTGAEGRVHDRQEHLTVDTKILGICVGDKKEGSFKFAGENYAMLVFALPMTDDFVVFVMHSKQGCGCEMMQQGKSDSICVKTVEILEAQSEASKDLMPTEWKLIMVEVIHLDIQVHRGAAKIFGVIVGLLTKSAHFLPIREDYKTEKLAKIYVNEIVARHGVRLSIIFRNVMVGFSHTFWQALQEALGTRLDMSTAYHPQIDGQSERTIRHGVHSKLRTKNNGSEYIQSVAPEKMKDPGLFILPCRLGDSKPFDTLSDLGSRVNLLPFKVGLLEETDDVLGLADGIKSYPVGIVRNVEVHVGKLKLFEDFHVVDMERELTCLLLVGRGFLATANAVIDFKKAKIAIGEGLIRSIFGVKELDFGDDNVPYWTTIGKRKSYRTQTSKDGIGARPPYYAKRDFLNNHLPEE